MGPYLNFTTDPQMPYISVLLVFVYFSLIQYLGFFNLVSRFTRCIQFFFLIYFNLENFPFIFCLLFMTLILQSLNQKFYRMSHILDIFWLSLVFFSQQFYTVILCISYYICIIQIVSDYSTIKDVKFDNFSKC